MIFYYIRHGEPIYNPDSLTDLGHLQSEALAKYFADNPLDIIYSSTSNRAILTAKPTCENLNKEPVLLDFANEVYAFSELNIEREDQKGKIWLTQDKRIINLFNSKEIRVLGDRWYDYPELKKYNYEKGINRIYDESDAFLKSLGYEHIRYTGKYKVNKANNKKVALFAHEGFGLAFLSCILDIPYPMFCTHFDMCHTGVTIVDFNEIDGFCVPKILTLSSDSHLYSEGIETNYKF